MNMPLRDLTADEIRRFESKIDKTPGFGPNNDCWKWTGHLIPTGYGRFTIREPESKHGFLQPLSHRIAYLLHKGRFDPSLLICHSCDTPACVNPDHLFAGTHFDNAHDCRRKKRLGARRGLPKVSREDVIAIRAAAARGESSRSIAKRYNISESGVSCIIKGKTWRAVGGPLTKKFTQLSDVAAKEARLLYASGRLTKAEIARRFHIEKSTIGKILSGETHPNAGGPLFAESQPKLPRKIVDEIIKRVNANEDRETIARDLDISVSKITKTMYKHRQKTEAPGPRSITDERNRQIIEANNDGASLTELAERFKVSKQIISTTLYRHRLKNNH